MCAAHSWRLRRTEAVRPASAALPLTSGQEKVLQSLARSRTAPTSVCPARVADVEVLAANQEVVFRRQVVSLVSPSNHGAGAVVATLPRGLRLCWPLWVVPGFPASGCCCHSPCP